MERRKIEEVIEKITQEACLSEEEAFPSLEGYIQDIVAIYMSLIEALPAYKEQGIDLPEEVILQQVKNLEEAIQHKDMIKLYDTLKFEVLDTFNLYREIQVGME